MASFTTDLVKKYHEQHVALPPAKPFTFFPGMSKYCNGDDQKDEDSLMMAMMMMTMMIMMMMMMMVVAVVVVTKTTLL